MAKKSRKSEKQQELERLYRKERKRVLQLIRRNEARGLVLNTPHPVPEIPQKITQSSINKLKKIDKNYLLKHGKGVDLETGEILSTKQIQQRWKKEAEEKRKAKKKTSEPLTTKITTEDLVKIRQQEEQKMQEEREKRKKMLEEAKTKQETTPDQKEQNIVSEEELAIKNLLRYLNQVYAINPKRFKGVPTAQEWLENMMKLYGKKLIGRMIIDANAAGVKFSMWVLYEVEDTAAKIAEFMFYIGEAKEKIDEMVAQITNLTEYEKEMWNYVKQMIEEEGK